MRRQAKRALIIVLFLAGILMASSMSSVIAGKPAKECNDDIDNDGDGAIDLADAGCDNKNDNDETNCGDGVCEGGEDSSSCLQDCPTECSDDIDNDGDTYIDYPADPGCTSASDTSELGTVQCDNGADDSDADSLVDYPDDAGCSSPSDNDEIDGHCDDGIDNDGDNYTDYPSDPECTSYASKEGNCNETDSEFDIFMQGTSWGSTGGIPYNYTDYCIDSIYLNEYWCQWWGNGEVSSDAFNCTWNATGCANGACFW